MANLDKVRHHKIEKSLLDIEKYATSLVGDTNSPLSKLIDAQHLYTKLSDITANSILSNHSRIACGITQNTARSSKTARQQADSVLSALLHELASMLYARPPGLASQLALASHIVAKGVSLKLTKFAHKEAYTNLLSVAGVANYADVSANTLCQRLKSADIKMFLGGSMLQQGLFVTFLLNNVLFANSQTRLRWMNFQPTQNLFL